MPRYQLINSTAEQVKCAMCIVDRNLTGCYTIINNEYKLSEFNQNTDHMLVLIFQGGVLEFSEADQHEKLRLRCRVETTYKNFQH